MNQKNFSQDPQMLNPQINNKKIKTWTWCQLLNLKNYNQPLIAECRVEITHGATNLTPCFLLPTVHDFFLPPFDNVVFDGHWSWKSWQVLEVAGM